VTAPRPVMTTRRFIERETPFGKEAGAPRIACGAPDEQVRAAGTSDRTSRAAAAQRTGGGGPL